MICIYKCKLVETILLMTWTLPTSSSGEKKQQKNWFGQLLKTKHGDVRMSSAPPSSNVEGSAERKERTSKWWKRERSGTVALANVFPGCSYSNQTPDLWCCLTDHRQEKKRKKKGGKNEEPSRAVSRTLQSLCGNKQRARTGSHCAGDARASMTVLRKLKHVKY